jgi:hypothetical protein
MMASACCWQMWRSTGLLPNATCSNSWGPNLSSGFCQGLISPWHGGVSEHQSHKRPQGQAHGGQHSEGVPKWLQLILRTPVGINFYYLWYTGLRTAVTGRVLRQLTSSTNPAFPMCKDNCVEKWFEDIRENLFKVCSLALGSHRLM